MTLFGLIWSNLFRKRTRTVLTLLSVAIAFLLFMLLRGVAGAFERLRIRRTVASETCLIFGCWGPP